MKQSKFTLALYALTVTACFTLIGCAPPPPSNVLVINTSYGKLLTTGDTVLTPLGLQPLAGQLVSTITSGTIQPFGTTTSFQGVTSPDDPATMEAAELTGTWPTNLDVINMEMPAYWNIEWSHPPNCYDITTPPYQLWPQPYVYQNVNIEPSTTYSGPFLDLTCYTNNPATAGFVPGNVSPQFALDDANPPTLQVAAFIPILAPSSITNLRVFGTDLSNPANVTASSIGSNGTSAIFPYPKQSNGTSLPAGAYITTITTDPPGGSQTTNGMEPFYIGHDDMSFAGAYGVAIASPKELIISTFGVPISPGSNTCTHVTTTSGTVGGTPLPLVTLLTQGALAVGTSATKITVGTNPTVVIPFHDAPKVVNVTSGCIKSLTDYSGAQSALVVNTGSNSVSIVNIGQYALYPTGMVAVGNKPVAAAINPTETMAYVANYADGTISEINLSTLQQTRVLAVMIHPASVTFDTNGNLWVGGQGSVMDINTTTWSVVSSSTVNGTINGMSYDPQQGVLIQTLLQNGTPSLPLPTTALVATNFSTTPQVSFSSSATFGVAALSSTPSTTLTGDNSSYSSSSISAYLAFPGQTAFSPPIYSATAGDITATANGTSFAVTVLATGQVLIQGTLPHPPRGIALTSNMLYFTMPETGSLVSIPIVIPTN